jgi:hypothetical protein
MSTGKFSRAQLMALYEELDHECAEYAREHGEVTAAQRNQIAARLMEMARNNPPPPPLTVIGPHGT